MKHSMKVCRVCGVEKSIRCFYRTKTGGHRNSCKPCHIAQVEENKQFKREYYDALNVQRRATDEYRAANAERMRQWRQTDVGRQSCNDSLKFWRQANPERAREINREASRRYREKRRAVAA